MKTFIGAVGGAFLGLLAVESIRAAVSPGTTQDDVTRIVPFRGTIERHGSVFSGDVDMRFKVYDAETDGTLRWTEEHSPSAGSGRNRITAYAGEFTALLGLYDSNDAVDDLVDVVSDGEALWVAVEVRTPGQATYTALNGRQQLTAAPYTTWAGQSSELEVGDDVTVSGKLTAASFSTASQVAMPASDARIALGFTSAGAGQSGKHGITFVDGSGADDGAQLVYDTSSNQLQMLKKDGSTSNVIIDLDDGSMTTRGALSVGSSATTATTIGGKVTVASGKNLKTDTYGKIQLEAQNDSTYMGVAFGDTDGGIQMVYNTAANALVFEVGDSFQTTGNDLLTFDYDDKRMYVHRGDLKVGGYVIRSRVSKSGGSEVDSTLDKMYYADSSCPSGGIQVGKNGGSTASICVCMNAEEDLGWYCFD